MHSSVILIWVKPRGNELGRLVFTSRFWPPARLKNLDLNACFLIALGSPLPADLTSPMVKMRKPVFILETIFVNFQRTNVIDGKSTLYSVKI